MKTISSLLLIAALLLPAQAGGVILLENDLHPLPVLFQYDVTVWLENNPPAETHLYAVMNYSLNEHGEFVSLAGLDPNLPAPYQWSLMDSSVIWVGSVHRVAGEIKLHQPEQQASAHRLARLAAGGPGGGVDIYLPWEAGKQMFFGERGVHGGGFGVSNAIGLDFVSGDDFGAQAASNIVYASASGTVDAVCEGTYNKGVLIVSSTNTIGYLHLTPNNPLEEGDIVQRGQPIGRLAYGSFNESCGNAQQQPDHYHLHWIVIPANNRFQAEGWVLNTSTQEWKRGNETVKKRQWLTGGGGSGFYENEDDSPTETSELIITPGDPELSGGGGGHLWDYVIIALNDLYADFKSSQPDTTELQASSAEYRAVSMNMMRTMIQDWNIILVNDVINITPWFWFFGAFLVGEIARWILVLVISGPGVLAYLRSAFKWW